MKHKLPALALLACAVTAGTFLAQHPTRASDHDDGVTDIKTENLNLTDLYVFREDTQKPGATAGNLIFVMNCNPRSVAKQNKFFNTLARYEFHVSRVGKADKNDDPPKGKAAVTLRFEFEAPDANNVQKMKVTSIKDGGAPVTVTSTTTSQAINTTPFNEAKSPRISSVMFGDQTLTVFAGLREDPFFFDVNRFFALRSTAEANFGKPSPSPLPTFHPTAGDDFTKGFNVLSIVARVPRAFLQEAAEPKSTTFDVWETISVKK